jgi:hypothetical protein
VPPLQLVQTESGPGGVSDTLVRSGTTLKGWLNVAGHVSAVASTRTLCPPALTAPGASVSSERKLAGPTPSISHLYVSKPASAE